MANVKELYAKINATANGFNSVMDGLATKTEKTARNVTRSTSSMTKGFQNVTGNMGERFNSIGKSLEGVSERTGAIGGKMTKSITKPVGIATAAVGGLVGALGFKRLEGMDQAQAKLEGLGYKGKEVEKIQGQIANAIEGGMTTMAEGTDVAAGALAAGVEQGKDLEGYVKAVGNAAVGANVPVEEMSQIFNRVKGSGKLAGTELEMMEQRLPGFANTMADQMGLGIEEFREKVSAGEVGFDDFMEGVESRAGDAAEAQAKTFSGMITNIKAYIGQIGEAFLGPAFEEAKKVMAEMIEALNSDELRDKAKVIGEQVAPVFAGLARAVANTIKWLINLPSPVQKAGLAFGALLVALGPILQIVGKLTGMLAGMFKTFGTLMTFVAGLNPVTLIIMGIVAALIALGTAFYIAYQKSEPFRNFVNGIGEKIKVAIEWFKQLGQAIGALFKGDDEEGTSILKKLGFSDEQIEQLQVMVERIKGIFTSMGNAIQGIFKEVTSVVKGLFTGIVDFITEYGPQILQAISNFIELMRPTIELLKGIISTAFHVILDIIVGVFRTISNVVQTVWHGIVGIISGALQMIKGIIQLFAGVFTGDFSLMWEGIKNIFSGALQAILSLVKMVFKLILDVVGGIMRMLWSVIRTVWNGIRMTITNVVTAIWNNVKNIFTYLKNSVINIFNSIRAVTVVTWNLIKNAVLNAVRGLRSGAIVLFNALRSGIQAIWNGIKAAASATWNWIKNTVINLIRVLRSTAINVLNSLRSGMQAIWNGIKNAVSATWNWIKNTIVRLARSLRATAISVFNSLRSGMQAIWNGIKAATSATWNWIRNTVVRLARALRSMVVSTFNNLRNAITNIWNVIRSITTSVWTGIKNVATRMANILRNGVSSAFRTLRSVITGIWNAIRSTTTNVWTGIKNTVTSLVDTLKNRVVGTFRSMRDILEGIIDKIKGFITSMIDKVKGGLNKLIKGVNWVGGKLGMDKIPDVKFHTGTTSTSTNLVRNGRLNTDTFATVGDRGKGNGPKGFRRETIIPPKGKPFLTPNRDTTMPLSKGTQILNGKQTHGLLSGTTPKFSDGTGSFLESARNKVAKYGAKGAAKAHGVKQKAVDTYEKGKEKVGQGAKWLKDKVGDVMDYVKKPGKLLEHILKAYNVNFDGLGKNNIPADMMSGMFKKLKDSAKNLIKQWLEDAEEGSGDASWLFKHPIWQKFGNYTGGLNFNGGKHYGMDFGMDIGTPVKAVAGGKVSRVWNDYGGGKSVEIEIGKGMWNWYMHLSEQLAKKGQKIEAGDVIGKSGDTGNYVKGAHLHFQLMKGDHPGNDTAVNPESWLKGLKGGGSKAASKWTPQIKQAAKATGTKINGANIKDIIKLIDTESSGNPKVTQGIKDVNSGGNEAKGLLQFTPKTFAGYATKGGKNILNGVHQLKAFFNNSNWRRDLSAWKGRMARGSTGWGPTGNPKGYAEGGIINAPEMAWLAEGGFSESVISHDPKHRMRSKVLHDKTGEMLGVDTDTRLLQDIVDLIAESNNIQLVGHKENRKNAEKYGRIMIDGKEITNHINGIQGDMLGDIMWSRGE